MTRTLFERVLYLSRGRKSVWLFVWQTDSSALYQNEAYGLRRRWKNGEFSICMV